MEFTGWLKDFDSRPRLVSFSVLGKLLVMLGNDEDHLSSNPMGGAKAAAGEVKVDQDILCFSLRTQKEGRGNRVTPKLAFCTRKCF